MQEIWVWFLGGEDSLEKKMATHSSMLAWEIPSEDPGGLQSMELQRIRHDLATKQQRLLISVLLGIGYPAGTSPGISCTWSVHLADISLSDILLSVNILAQGTLHCQQSSTYTPWKSKCFITWPLHTFPDCVPVQPVIPPVLRLDYTIQLFWMWFASPVFSLLDLCWNVL